MIRIWQAISRIITGFNFHKTAHYKKCIESHPCAKCEYTYYVDLMVPDEMTFKTLEVTEGDLEDVDVLIGMDVISQGDFCISNGNNETVVAFRSPAGEPIKFESNK